MKKRILAGALAFAMAFSLSTVALAAEGEETVDTPDKGAYTSSEITGDSTLNTLTVDVTVPTVLSVTVNPYKLEVELEGDAKSTEQIIGTEMELVSASNVALSVGIKIGADKAEAAEGTTNNAVIASSSVAGDKAPTTNSIFSYLEVTGGKEKLAANTAYKAGTKTEKSNDYVFPALKAGKQATDPKTGYLEAKDVVTLAIGIGNSDGTNKAQFKVKGDAVAAPALVWTSADKLTYSITYNFVPVVTAPAAAAP